MATTSDSATVDQAGRAGIARKHGETNVVFFFLELTANFRVFLNSLLLALVALDPGFLGHNSEPGRYSVFLKGQAESFLELT